MTTFEHGAGGYCNHACRCAVCREAWRLYMKSYRARGAQRRRHAEANGERYIAEGVKHGITGYNTHGCRCDVCRAAKAAENGSRYASAQGGAS